MMDSRLILFLAPLLSFIKDAAGILCDSTAGVNTVSCPSFCCSNSNLYTSTFLVCCSTNSALNTANNVVGAVSSGISTVIIVVIVVSVLILLGIVACIVCCCCGICAAAKSSTSKGHAGAVVQPAPVPAPVPTTVTARAMSAGLDVFPVIALDRYKE